MQMVNSFSFKLTICYIVFTPKYHRKIIYGALREDIGKILRELCQRKEVEIIEAHAIPDHIYMLVCIQNMEQAFLESRILCTHHRYLQASGTEIYSTPKNGRFDFQPNQYGGILRPVQKMVESNRNKKK